MLLPDDSSSTSSTSCLSKDEALLQVLFRPDPASVTVQQNGGMTISLTSLSNGTTMDSLHFRRGDAIVNVSTCLARRTTTTTTTTGCYGLELINAWTSYNVSIVYDGIAIKDTQYQQFPYYVTPRSVKGSGSGGNSVPRYGVVGTSNSGTDDDDEDEVAFAPYESNVTFVEIGSSSCIPTCNSSSQDLYTVQTFAGNQGDGSFGWRMEQQGDDSIGQVDLLMGCGAAADRLGDSGGDSSADPCVEGGGLYRIRIERSCLPKSVPRQRRRFVMGHPNSIPAEPTPIRNNTAMNMSTSLWEGHYPPKFQIWVNDVVVANGTVTTFVAMDIEHTNNNGTNGTTSTTPSSNQCPGNTSLFELFQYSTAPYEYSVQDLSSGNVVSTSMNATANNGSSLATMSTPLRYVRQCINPSGCYDLTIQASSSSSTTTSNSSSTTSDYASGVSTQAVLGGIYYTNAFLRYVPFHVTLGDACTRHQVCPLVDESLLRIDIHMSDALEEDYSYMPSYYCAWSVFRTGGSTSSSLESVMPEESMSYFSNGYPGGSEMRHYMCVPKDDDWEQQGEGELTFGMLHSIPMNVDWSISRDGVPLDCRSATQVESTSGGYIVMPLDGSCPPNRTSSGPNSGPPQPPSSMLATGLFVGIVGGILAMVAVLAAILVSKSNAGVDESNVRRLPGWPSPAGADRRRRQSLRRRFSTRSNGTESMSISDDDDECNVRVGSSRRQPMTMTTTGVEGGSDGDA